MGQSKNSFQIAVDGTFLNSPATIAIGQQNGELVFCGTVKWEGKRLSESIGAVDQGMLTQFGGYVDDLLPVRLPDELYVYYRNQFLSLGVREDSLYFKVAKAGDSMALLFAFQLQDNGKIGQDASVLVRALETAASFFGIREFLFYAQKGNQWLLPKLRPGDSVGSNVPAEIKRCSFFTYAHIKMEGSSVFVNAVRTLFGLKETELYVGAGKNAFTCMISIPAFETTSLQGKDMYMLMELGGIPKFRIRGSFVFRYVPDITFTVDCGVGANAFELQAFAEVKTPVPLFGPFSIGDTCLMIQVSSGLAFGMYTNLYIRKIQLFGAMVLRVEGTAVVPELLSAAVSDLSIPILVENLLGRPVDGIEALDFIKILGLPFQDMAPFQSDWVQRKDSNAIVQRFNSEVKETSLQLDASQVKLTAFGDGLDVTDLKRMRHYYIDRSGRLKLTAQFYYATKNRTLGNYTVEVGLFICGAIEIFNKRFEVLFSFRENEGLLAYAKIPAIDLGFLKIGPSAMNKGNNNMLPVAQNSVLSQFIGNQRDGMVFFLTAGPGNVSFYFDGMVELLAILRADARVIFCKGLISLDLRVVWLSILQVSLHISVNYEDFTRGGFAFLLVIDTSRLTEKLQAVTQNINSAISRLRNKINNAKREIDRAQAHVNELYGQIRNFDRKIEDCRRAIRNASWWKKAFVAIAKGIEIGGYEIAKAGVYAAIGLATAALKVAKAVVDLSGKVGEGVMRAVNAVIQGAMSLFYINYLKLGAKANRNERYFQAEIQFVALGKTYTLNKTIGIQAFTNSPAGELSGAINNRIQPDLDHIEDGSFNRSNWQRYRRENETVEQHCKRLDQSRRQLKSSISMMTGMQNTYVNEFQTPMEEFDEMNVSLMNALDDVENVLDTGVQAGDVSQLANSMGGLKRSVAAQEKKGVFRDEELAQTKEVIAQYDEARMFYDKVVTNLGDVQKYKKEFEQHSDAMKKETQSACGECIMSGVDGSVASVLQDVEQQLYENFPVDRSGADFINPSREPVIRECFIEAEKELGIEPSKEVQAMRSRSRKGSYKSRL